MKFTIIIPVRSINNFLNCVLIILDTLEKYDFKDARFKVIAVGSKGPGEKRNIGAKKATGDILVFLDDDAYPRSDWLKKAKRIFSTTSTYALGAPAITPINASFLERCSGRIFESWLCSAGAVCRYLPQSRRLINDFPTVN